MNTRSMISSSFGNAVLCLNTVLLLMGGASVQAQIGRDWIDRSTVGVRNSREALVYADGLYVAASENAGAVETSTNGDAWTTVSTGLFDGIKGIVWNGSQFLAVAYTSLATSTNANGSAWTVSYPFSGSSIQGIARAGINVVAVGSANSVGGNPVLYLSTDSGANWAEQTLPSSTTAASLNAVTHTGSQWVAVGQNGTIYTSANGTTWARRTVAALARISFATVTNNSSLIVAAGVSYSASFEAIPEVWTSSNGIAWTKRTVSANLGFRSVVWTGTNFVAVTEGSSAITSPDGITWTTQSTETPYGLYALAWDGTQVLAVGNGGVVLSSDLLPTASVGMESSTVLESDGTAKVAVYLSKPAPAALSIPLVITGTAAAVSDYTAPSSVAFASGESIKIVEISLINDTLVEGTFDDEEQIIITLGPVAGANIKSPKSQTIKIIDGDGPPLVNFSLVQDSTHSVSESVGTVTVGIELSWPATSEVTIPIVVTGAASAGSDYTGMPATVTFTAGQTVQSVSFTVVNDEVEETPEEEITLGFGTLPVTVQSGIGNRQSFTVRVDDDDPAAALGRRWSLRQPTPSSASIEGMTMAASGRAVMVNSAGQVLISDDAGATWTEKYCGNSNHLRAVASNGGVLVGVGDEGAVIRSTDNGENWTARQIPEMADSYLYAVARNATEFLATGVIYDSNYAPHPAIYASADGLRWEQRAVPSASRARAFSIVSMGGTKWAVVGFAEQYDSATRKYIISTLILTTEDGIIWTDRSSGITGAQLEDIIWTGTTLVAFAADFQSRQVFTSVDGNTWVARSLGTASNASAGVWTGSKIVTVGFGATSTCNSAAGFPWTQKPSAVGAYLYDILWTGSSYIARGDNSIFTSTNGDTWVPRSTLANSFERMTAAVWSGSQFVAVANVSDFNPGVFTSTNGSVWSRQKLPRVNGGLNGIAWSGTTFAAVGTQGLILTSTNGTTWTPRPLPGITLNISEVIWAGNQFVAVGGNRTYSQGALSSLVLTSPDGVKWTQQTVNSILPLQDIAWNGSLFVAVGQDELVITSPNAINWTKQTTNILNSYSLNSVAWSGTNWVVVGEGNTIIRSADAVTWETSNAPSNSTSAALNDILWTGTEFIVATSAGKLWHSETGETWKERGSPTTQPLNGLALGNTLLALGDEGTILSSGSLPPAAPEIFFDAATSTAPETDKAVANVLVRLSKPATTTVTVPLNTSGSTGMTLTGLLADVTLTAPLQVVFRPGELAKFVPITVKGDFRAEGPENLTLSFGTLPSTVTAGTTAAHEITLQDNDEALIIANQPADRLLAVGSSLTLSVALTAGSGPVAYQWTKDGKVIPKATGPLFYLNAVQITDGGSYACNVMNPVGSQPSTAARVGVYEVATRAVYVDAAKTPVEATVTQAASSNCAVNWFKDGSSTPIASGGAFLLSNNNRSLKISSLDSNSGEYVCKVGLPSSSISDTPSGATWNVGTASGKPELPTITFAEANIGVSYQSATFSAANSTKVTSWAATGLPLGLRLVDLGNHQFQVTGLPSVASTRQVTITATNGKGSTAVTVPLKVNALPAGLIGTSIGLIDREETVNNFFGGRMQFTFASTGVFSGSYIVGGTTQSFTGQITAATATTATASATFFSGINSVTISMTYDSMRTGASGMGSITVTVPSPMGPLPATANFKTWTRHLAPAPYAGRYHFAIMQPSGAAGDLSLPQGAGYGIATVTPAGVTTFTGKLGDGSALTGSSVINTDGTTIAYSVINKDRGSFMAIPKIALGIAPSYASSTVEDFTDASWGRLQSLLPTREYADGWFPSALEISGGKYIAPASGQIVMDLPDVQFTANADISFTQAGIDSGSTVGTVVEIEANGSAYAYNSFQYPTDYFTKLKITPATGVFSGTLDLSGSVNDISIKRSPISYDGLIIPSFKSDSIATGDYQGVGQFKLPQLPDANTSPMPSAASTPILTGRVKLIKIP
ncbi:MAG: hypothetical protein NTV80_18760 [Verrucomicrobia bacterium]|nr:hypothetical protein [Verrucomicrobiota bacterium]